MVNQDEVIGAMLGTFTGDALGMPYVGQSHSDITTIEMKPGRSRSAGSYTDDTQMAIATAKSLLACHGIDREHLAEEYARHYEADRGYGSSTREVFNKWNQGVSIDRAAQTVFDGEGSFGNGGAMRIAPVAVYFGGEFSRLDKAVKEVVSLTHAHPLGIGGALLQARAVGTALRMDPDDFEGGAFLETVFESFPSKYDPDGEYEKQKAIVREFLDDATSRKEVIKALGNVSFAQKSVMTAMFSFLSNPSSFEDAVVYAVSLGGDADTIGAMAGAISGAYRGYRGIPDHWWEFLENVEDGRDEVVVLAKKLLREGRMTNS